MSVHNDTPWEDCMDLGIIHEENPKERWEEVNGMDDNPWEAALAVAGGVVTLLGAIVTVGKALSDLAKDMDKL